MKPPVEEPLLEGSRFLKPPSQFFKLARRLSQKTTVREPVQPTEAVQEAFTMLPPDILEPQEPLPQPDDDQALEQASNASSYASLDPPIENPVEERSPSAAKKTKRWRILLLPRQVQRMRSVLDH